MAQFIYTWGLWWSPKTKIIWLLLGHSLREQGKYGLAAAYYRRARRLLPRDEEADVQLGNLYFEEGRFSLAQQHYYRVHRRKPENTESYCQLLEINLNAKLTEDMVYEADGAVANKRNTILYDISGLVEFLLSNGQVSGIQRIQVELLKDFLKRSASKELNEEYVLYNAGSRMFVILNRRLLEMIAKLNVKKSHEFLGEIIRIMKNPRCANELTHAHLVNLAYTKAPRYYETVNSLRRGLNWTYYNFVHDCIPTTHPQYFETRTAADFKTTMSGLSSSADVVLVSSDDVRNDLLKHFVPVLLPSVSIRKVQLASFLPEPISPAREKTFLESHGLKPEQYVLFVSTIEIRKNHRLAMEGWKRLAKQHGHDQIPRLVFAGRPGWLAKDVLRELARQPAQDALFLHLEGLSDIEIQMLYRNCMFSVFPSFKEGWGLPVTESLSFGRIVLASTASSVKEAGGDFSVYFDPTSLKQFTDEAERLILNATFRSNLEAKLRSGYKIRDWGEVSKDIRAVVRNRQNHGDEESENVKLPIN